jgi:hypothetical protein
MGCNFETLPVGQKYLFQLWLWVSVVEGIKGKIEFVVCFYVIVNIARGRIIVVAASIDVRYLLFCSQCV